MMPGSLRAVLAAFVTAWSVTCAADGPRKRVTILFTNDAHTHVDSREGLGLRYSHVAWLKKECAKKGPVFLADAGDYLQGTAYGVFDGGVQMVGLMNAAGYDVATIGNHEFDFHTTNLLARVRQADFPIVSCNVWRRDAPDGERSHAFASYAVLTNGGVSVAFVGLTTPDTTVSESPGHFRDPQGGWRRWGFWGYPASAADELYDRVQEAVDAARAWSPDYVVLLGHAGLTDELRPCRSIDIVAHTSGCDCFIDGHSHTEMAREVVTNKVGKAVVVAQAGSFLAAVGRIELAQGEEPKSELVKCVGGKDAEVSRLEDRLIGELGFWLSDKLADLSFDMPAKSETDGTWIVRTQATAIGDLEADAFYWYANRDGAAAGADVAIVHGGGIRDGLRAGPVTLKEAVAVNPFLNEMLVAEMPGRTLLEALEWGARAAPSPLNSKLLHVAGLRYSIATNLPPRVGRVRDVTVYDRKDGAWKPLDPAKAYRVASMDFLLRNGGSGFFMLTNSVPVAFFGGAEPDARQFADYLKNFKNGILSTENSPLYGLPVADSLSYERARGGERIRFVSVRTGD